MPVPWHARRARSFIPNIAERALTVKQLEDLRTFLQRVCKAKLLQDSGATGSGHLQWHELNLYHVTDEVIKPVIRFHHQTGKEAEQGYSWPPVFRSLVPTDTKGYSWAELVAEGPQPPQLMISHWWGGRFLDFMSAIDKIVDRRALSISATIWICTFANNQFGESFGAGILQTPFVKAIQKADATILVIDRDAGSLRRSWCCLELHYTILKEKSLELYTPAGQVGSESVSSGPLVDAISEWDVRDSAASEEAYRRQILNFIADVPDYRGLLTKDSISCKLDLADGYRPQLDPAVSAESERNFMLEHQKAFEDLNMNVRVSVIGSIGPQKRAKGCRIANSAHRGITLGQLRTFAKKAKRCMKKLLPNVPWEEVITHDVNKHFILPLTKDDNCSYVELVADEPQVPWMFIDYQLSMRFLDIMTTVEWFAEAMNLKDSEVFFFNLLAFNQHKVLEEVHRNCYDKDNNLVIDKAQSECSSFLCTSSVYSITNLEKPFAKWSVCHAWRLYSIECAVRLGQAVYLACPSGAMACTKLFPNGHSKFGSIDRIIMESIFNVYEADMENAPCAVDKDRQKILSFIQGPNGCGLKRLQRRFQRWSAFHLVLVWAGHGELVNLRKLSAVPGFSVEAELAKGGLGESALHEAVAAASTEAVKVLLHAGLSPNSTDAMQETPLHYAVLAGNSNMVQLLVTARADVLMESIFGETPLDVAAQNVAAFLGRDSSQLVLRLQEIENQACGERFTTKLSL
ncbi:unnamed protein product [Effrenium voratum]|uniref:Uncharacterized protein n=1 Tax=Effrenium voratum TaxID=2562239 RepID=A0AA36J5Q9_9DINO|nr:unnamed protein product [Effrenium voratum]CAJ1461224.1 unnamed protein product [Effrenium voratum]